MRSLTPKSPRDLDKTQMFEMSSQNDFFEVGIQEDNVEHKM